MFTNISIGQKSKRASDNPPSEADCKEILDMLNQVSIPSRTTQDKYIEETLMILECEETGRYPNCHSFVERVIGYYSNNQWTKISGYLFKSSIKPEEVNIFSSPKWHYYDKKIIKAYFI